jgi:hypothetical protein
MFFSATGVSPAPASVDVAGASCAIAASEFVVSEAVDDELLHAFAAAEVASTAAKSLERRSKKVMGISKMRTRRDRARTHAARGRHERPRDFAIGAGGDARETIVKKVSASAAHGGATWLCSLTDALRMQATTTFLSSRFGATSGGRSHPRGRSFSAASKPRGPS